jgi:hypothetical protein
VHGVQVSYDECLFKSPESEDTISPTFAAWVPTLMDYVSDDPNIAWQYFGHSSTGNMMFHPYFNWQGGYDYE